MTLETTLNAARSRAITLGTLVALACSGCASQEKSGGSGPGAGMSPPPMTAAYDPTRTMASAPPSALWGAAPSPAAMPTASANGTRFNR